MLILRVLIISSSNTPIVDLLVFGFKSTTLCQALAKADAACLTKFQDPRSTRSSEIEQHSNRDVTVKSSFGDFNSQILLWFQQKRRKEALYNLLTKGYLVI